MKLLKAASGRNCLLVRAISEASKYAYVYWLDTKKISRVDAEKFKFMEEDHSAYDLDFEVFGLLALENYNNSRREYQAQNRKKKKNGVVVEDTPPALNTPLGALHHLFMDTSEPRGTSRSNDAVMILGALEQMVDRFAERYGLENMHIAGDGVTEIEKTHSDVSSAIGTLKALGISASELEAMLS